MIHHNVVLDMPEGTDSLAAVSRSLVCSTNIARLLEMAADNLNDDEAIPLTMGLGVLIASMHDVLDRVEQILKLEGSR